MNLGAGERIFFPSITVENFKEIILKVLEDPSYTKNAQDIARRFKDQPEKPLKRAIWWIEYILRNPNPDHLQSPTMELGSFISNGYDVFIFTLLVALLISILVFKLLQKCITCCENFIIGRIVKSLEFETQKD